MRTPLMIAVVLALVACSKQQPQQPAANETAEAPAGESGIKGVHRDNKGKPAPAAEFTGPD